MATIAAAIAVAVDPPRDKRKTWGARLYVDGKLLTSVSAKDAAGLMDGLIPWIERQHESE